MGKNTTNKEQRMARESAENSACTGIAKQAQASQHKFHGPDELIITRIAKPVIFKSLGRLLCCPRAYNDGRGRHLTCLVTCAMHAVTDHRKKHILPSYCSSPSQLLLQKHADGILGRQGYCCCPPLQLSFTWDCSVPARQSPQAPHHQAWADQTLSHLSTGSSRARRSSFSPNRKYKLATYNMAAHRVILRTLPR